MLILYDLLASATIFNWDQRTVLSSMTAKVTLSAHQALPSASLGRFTLTLSTSGCVQHVHMALLEQLERFFLKYMMPTLAGLIQPHTACFHPSPPEAYGGASMTNTIFSDVSITWPPPS